VSVLSCSNLEAGYGGVPVVRKFNLEIEPGEMVALLGANGAGKSTVLMTLAGLLVPIAGEIRLFGQPIPTKKPYRIPALGLSFVPDDRGLFATLTTKENLSLAAGKDRAVIEEVLPYFPALSSRLNLAAGMLSGGEQQMLALAKALVARPKVLLIDELSLGLAPVIAQQLLRVARRLADDTGTAVLFVEQHVHMALTVADRGVVMRHGDVELEGPARELLKNWSGLEASYLGEGHGDAVEIELSLTPPNGSRPDEGERS
jgi:branched-chain amino acid transport system ATP-binding protein